MRYDEEWLEEYYKKHPQRKQAAVEPEKKKSKYNARRVKVDGILFDSQLECDYYCQLKLRLRAGDIKGFCRQPEFILQEGTDEMRPITYRADFIVFNNDGTADVIDTKGFENETFKIKHKLFKLRYPGLGLKIEKR